MKRLFACSVLLLSLQVGASDTYMGTITSTGSSVNNTTTATPFAFALGQRVSVQCDAAAYVCPGTTTSASCASTNGVKLAADSLYDILLSSSQKYVAVISSSGTANCLVFKVFPTP